MIENISKIVEEIFPNGAKLHEPIFQSNAWKYVKECLDTRWVSSAGSYVSKFENKLADFTGISHVIAVVNGTSALHLVLKFSDIQPGDEVLMPAFTFVATANAVTYCGAIPHFVDSDMDTLGVDPRKLSSWLSEIADIRKGVCINKRTQRPIKALIAVHVFGHPVDLDSLRDICDQFHIKLIEDAAGALGSIYKSNHVGHAGLATIISFNGNKIITTGGGGAVLTNNEKLAMKIRHVSNTGKVAHEHPYYYDTIGYNYRMPNVNAALGYAQLENISETLKLKRNLAQKYKESFMHIKGITFVSEPLHAHSNYWLNAIKISLDFPNEKEKIIEHFQSTPWQVQHVWKLLPELPMYQGLFTMDLSQAKALCNQLITLPSSLS